MMRAPILAALVLAACGDAASPGFSTGPGITGVAASTSDSSTADTTSTGPANDSAGSSGSSGSSGTGIVRDVGAETDFGPGQPPGCKGKVDLLLVISRHGTMVTEQEQLLASFPDFIKTIEHKLEGFDVHIMTANPDGYWPGWTCENQYCIGEKYWPNCGPGALDYQCGVFPDMMTACDEQLGAGLIFNAGGDAANKLCDLYGGHRYIISGEPDMAGAFECIAKVGVAGDASLLGDAVIAALSSASNGLNGPGGCNEGFLREDALLVVALISDNWDYSKSYAKQQYEAILDAKKDPSAVVLLAVVPELLGKDEPIPPGGCAFDPSPPRSYEELFSKFPYTVYGDTCAPSYATFFDQAVDKIAEACGNFIPQ